jgi:hypothetical protein
MENITYESVIALLSVDSEGALNGELLINNKPYYIRKHWSNNNIAVWEKGPDNPPVGEVVFKEDDPYIVMGNNQSVIFTIEPIK